MTKKLAATGAVLAFLAVGLGAFGAHGLKGQISDDLLAAYQTGVQYHMYHALGLLLIAALADKIGGGTKVVWSARLMLLGVVLFSGSLYAMALSGVTYLGAITPLGGVCFLTGWVLFALAAWRRAG